MSELITRARLEAICATINREAKPQQGKAYMIEYAYGQPVLVLNDIKTLCGRTISPRCSKGQLAVWLFAFLEGIREFQLNTESGSPRVHTVQSGDKIQIAGEETTWTVKSITQPEEINPQENEL